MPTSVRVLVIEDIPDDAELTVLELRRGGLDPAWQRVESADELRAALAGGPWDVVLADYTLPGFGAMAALGIVREHDPDLPFVVVSGTVGEEVSVQAMRAGASDYVLKHALARLAPAVEREVREAANRRVKRAAERAAAHLAAVVASSFDAVISETLDGVLTSWNLAAERLYGWTAAEVVGRHISFLVPPDRVDELAGILARLRRGEQVETFETVRLHRDGRRIDVSLTISPVLGPDGRVIGASKIARDITGEKKAEAALRASEARFRSLVDQAPFSVQVHAPDGRPVLANRAWEELWGVTLDRFPEYNLLGDPQHEARGVLPHLRRAFAGEPVRIPPTRYDPNETLPGRTRHAEAERWVAAVAYPIRDDAGRVGEVVVVHEDVTERVRAEGALQAAEARFRALVENSWDAVTLTDAAGAVVYTTPATTRVLGYAPEELLGRSMMDLVHPDDAAATGEAVGRAAAFGGTATCAYRYRHKDGTWRWTETTVTNLLADPAVGALVLNSRDVTDRRAAEQALRRSEADLRTLVEALPEIVWIGRPDGANEYANARWREYTGDRPDDPLGAGWERVIHPDDLPAVRGLWAAAVRDGTPLESEHRLRRHDGAYRWHLVRAQPARDAGGRVARWYGTCTDIDDRRRAEGAVQEAEERFRAFMDHCPAAAFIKDDAGRLLYVNPAWRRQFDPEPADWAGKTEYDFWPRETADVFRASDLACLAAGRPLQSEETGRVPAGGEDRTWLVMKFPLAGRPRRLGGMAWDVTDRRRAEAEVRRAGELLGAVADGTTDAIFVKDRAGRYLFCNAATARFVGRPAAEVLGRDDAALFEPESARLTMDRDREVMAAGRTETCEETLITVGLTRTFLVTRGPYREAAGGVAGVIGIARDVTDWKEAEAALRASEERYRSLAEAMPQIVWVTRPDGYHEYYNRQWYEYTGLSHEQTEGAGWNPVFHPDDQPLAWERWRHSLATGEPYEIEYRCRRHDGAYRWFLGRALPQRDADGRILRWFGTCTDIHDQRRAAEAIRLRDRAIRAVTQGILITDPNQPDNPIVYASPGFERLTGYAAADVLGRNCRLLQGKDTDRDAVARLREAIRGGDPATVEVLNYRKGGTPFWNEVSVAPVRDDAGRLTHFVGVQTDVTDRRRLEEQFRQSQKMEAIGQLAGGVAHDFNNLLTIINGYCDLLLQGLAPGDPSIELLAEIHKAGERSAGLTRQLLAFSRQQVLAPRVLDLNTVVADAEKMLRRLLGEDVLLTTAPGPGLWPVKADPGQLEQVLLNLAVNARDAMPTGGRLTIETRNVELDEAYAAARPDNRAGPHVLLAVSDTGCGMPPEVRDRVFEPFFTTKGPGKGTGLGLATVYGIVNQSGGHVDVHSEVGVGTTFKVYLPRAVSTAGGSKILPGLMTPPQGSETVLLVEDEDGVRALTRLVLARSGYAVLEAAGGVEAIGLADRHPGPIHLVVTDVVMPGLGGRQVAERVRERHPGARVLYVSGYTDDAVVRYGVLYEGVNFLQKPFSPVALAHKVREVLDSPAETG